jgi:hypothetical protein
MNIDKLCDLYDEALRRAGDGWAERAAKMVPFRLAAAMDDHVCYVTVNAKGANTLKFTREKTLEYIGSVCTPIVSVQEIHSKNPDDTEHWHFPKDDWATLRKSSPN